MEPGSWNEQNVKNEQRSERLQDAGGRGLRLSAGQRASERLTCHHGVALVRRQIPSNGGAGCGEVGLGFI